MFGTHALASATRFRRSHTFPPSEIKSLYGSITTLIGIGIGTTIGQDYDGTLLPFATGFFLCTLASLAVVLVVENGRLFKPHHVAVELDRPLFASDDD